MRIKKAQCFYCGNIMSLDKAKRLINNKKALLKSFRGIK